MGVMAMAEQAQGDGVQGIGRAVQALGLGERLIVLGAAGVLAVWLVFALLTREYGVGVLAFVTATAALYFAYRFHIQKAADWAVPYRTLILALGALLGLMGVHEFLMDMRYELYEVGGATFVGGILFWIAAIVAGVGAFQMAASRP